jgi:hypothetical protein
VTTTTISGWHFQHNSDMSGGCTIIRPSQVGHTMTIPFDVLMLFVAEVVRRKRIAELELATVEELLGLKQRTASAFAESPKP